MAPSRGRASTVHGASATQTCFTSGAAIRPAGVAAAWLLATLAGSAGAAEWRIQPSVNLSETYTDNVGLATAGNERGDFVTQVNPGVVILGQGSRLNVNVGYTLLTRVYSRDRDRNEINHSLSAGGRAEVISDVFFIDGRASISQQNISLLAPIGADITNDAANLTEIRTWSVTPTLKNRYSNLVSYEVRYQRDAVSGKGAAIDYSSSDNLYAALTGGTWFGRLGWTLAYSRQNLDYENSQDVQLENVALRLRYALNPRFGLTATTGYEKNNYVYIGEKPDGRFWTAGFTWQPSSLTSLDVSIGDRFFGRTYGLGFVHRSRSLVWNAGYSESITTSRQQFLIPQVFSTFDYLNTLLAPIVTDPLERALLVTVLIESRGLPKSVLNPVNFFSSRTFLDKAFSASVGFNAGKTTSSVNVFHSTRDALEANSASSALGNDNFNTSTNIRQVGGAFVFNWRFAPKTSVDFDTGLSETTYRDTGQVDKLRHVRAGIGHSFTPRTAGRIDVRHNSRTSTSAGAEYDENAVVASLGIRF